MNDMTEFKLVKALQWIDRHGQLVNAPFPDDEVAGLFAEMCGRDLIRRRKDRWVLNETALRLLGAAT